MILKVKKLTSSAILPEYAHLGDAGLDVFSVHNVVIPPTESRLIQTGIAIEIPVGYEAQVRPRSGLALKHQITVLNSPGTIDAGYRGEIGVILINHGKNEFVVQPGAKIAQLVISRVTVVEVKECTLEEDTTRGVNGFGSTGA